MNRWIGMGKLGRDPELTYTPSGLAVCKFSIACNHPYHPKDSTKTLWANCVAWKKTGELIQQYFTKGQQILVEGFVEINKWEKDGVKREAMQVTVEKFFFCGPPPGGTKAPAPDDSIPF